MRGVGRPRYCYQTVLGLALIAWLSGTACSAGHGGAAAGGAGGGTGGSRGAGGRTDAGAGNSDASGPMADAHHDDASRPDVASPPDGGKADGVRRDAGGGDATNGPFAEAPGLCEFGWCWSNPIPQGNGLTKACGRSPSDVWLVGGAATILHWDGTAYSLVPVGNRNVLHGVWCSPGGSVWAVGEQLVLKLTNGVLTDLTPTGTDVGSFEAVSGTGENDVWIAARFDTAYHWDGTKLTQVHKEATEGINDYFWDVVARAPNDVWFIDSSTTYHDDGSTFTAEALPGNGTLEQPSFWWAPGDLLLASDEEGMWSQQGSGSWQKVTSALGNPGDDLRMFGPSSTDLWMTVPPFSELVHWDGTAWSEFDRNIPEWTCGYAPDDDHLLVGGVNGRLARLATTPALVKDRALVDEGRGWDLPSFTGIWSSPDGDVQAVPGPYRLTANGWAPAPTTGAVGTLTAIWGSSASDVWAVGPGGNVAHFDGQSWSVVDVGLKDVDSSTLFAVTGTGPADVWAVGRLGMVAHYDGVSWTTGPTAGVVDLNSVWEPAPGDVWAVGATGALQRYTTAGGWTVSGVGDQALNGIWGTSDSDVWTSSSGNLWHWNGTKWSPTQIGPGTVRAIAGRATNDIWAVGQGGTLAHWNGTAWSNQYPAGVDLNALWVGPAGDVWLAGAGGAILRRH